MKLSRTVLCAIEALREMARSGHARTLSAHSITTLQKTPQVLLQVVRNLCRHGILTSVRDVEGGFSLARPSEQISLLEVIEAIEGPLVAEIPKSLRLPDDVQAILRDVCQDITDATRHRLSCVTLAQLVSEESLGNNTFPTSRPGLTPPLRGADPKPCREVNF